MVCALQMRENAELQKQMQLQRGEVDRLETAFLAAKSQVRPRRPPLAAPHA